MGSSLIREIINNPRVCLCVTHHDRYCDQILICYKKHLMLLISLIGYTRLGESRRQKLRGQDK